MTLEEIIDAFCRSRGLVRKEGASLIPLHPFLIMDCVLQIYTKWIAVLDDCRFEAKKYRNEWKKTYNALNRTFFKAFTPEQQDAVIDMMDDFDRYIYNDLVIAQMAIMDYFDTLEHEGRIMEDQQVASSCILAEVLCYTAKTTWERIFKVTGQMDVYDQIERITKSIHRFINAWYKPTTHIDVTQDQRCMDAISVLCKKVIRYLEVDAKNRKQSNSDSDE